MSKQIVNAYANFFADWQVKLLGAKPTVDMLTSAAAFCGHGTPGKQCLALAMAMRPEGVTAGQMQIACGGPQHNFRRGLVTDGHLKPVATPKNAAGHTVYRVELTAKGKAYIAKADKADAEKAAKADKPATAKPAKPRAAKPAKADAVTVTPAPAPVTAPADAGQPQG